MSFNQMYEKHQDRDRAAANKRQEKVDSEYRSQAKAVDKKYCNHDDPLKAGPVERRLRKDIRGRVWGLVVGAMGEVSDDLQALMEEMAERMSSKWKKHGARNKDEERAVAMVRIRRLIGIEAVRSMARLKLERAKWVCLTDDEKASIMSAERHQRFLLASHKESLAARYEVCVGPRSKQLNNHDLDGGAS